MKAFGMSTYVDPQMSQYWLYSQSVYGNHQQVHYYLFKNHVKILIFGITHLPIIENIILFSAAHQMEVVDLYF